MVKKTFVNGDICHCGNKTITQEIGYCEKCYAKRNQYIDRFIESIYLDSEQEDVLIRPYDELRKSLLSDRIGFLIDDYIAKFGKEPYGDTNFYLKALTEKSKFFSELIRDIKMVSSKNHAIGSMASFVANAYLRYLKKVVDVYQSDISVINSLNTNATNRTQYDVQRLVLESQKNGN